MIRTLLGLDRSEARSTGGFQEFFLSGADLAHFGGFRSASGKVVNNETALTVSAVYGSIRILSESVATLPMDAMIEWDGAHRPYRPTPEWLTFVNGPFSRIDVLSQTMVSLLTDGNAYLATYRNGTGQVVWVEVLDPATVHPERVGAQILYHVNGRTGLTAMDILHIPGMMLPGAIKGVSPVGYAREAIGLSMAATEYGAAFFGNGAIPKTVVEAPGSISEQGVARLKAAWNDTHQGSGNSGKLAVLTEGASFKTVSLSPDDSQFLDTRRFQVSDIARIYGVPPHLLADASGSTSWGSGLASQNATFLQHSLRPWLERIEAGLTFVMHSEGHSVSSFVKLNVDGLLRGDNKDRMNSYAAGLQNGIYTINEVRALEDLPPVAWGDEPLILKSKPAGTELDEANPVVPSEET
jgi:HK97 family phage portal protein